jgi:hypothetical protein
MKKNLTRSTIRQDRQSLFPELGSPPSKPISSQIWYIDLMHISENALVSVRNHALQTLILYHTCKLCQIYPHAFVSVSYK